MIRAYDDEYYGPDEAKFPPAIEAAVDRFRRRRATRLVRLLGHGGNALDIGCGNGKFLSFLQKEGFEIFGTELPGKAFERASKIPGIHLTRGELRSDAFEDASFDLVTLWHVFEHLERPKDTIETIARLVRRGGVVSLSMPNIESWQSALFRGDWFHLDPPRHLFFMGPREMSQAFVEKGFRIVSVSHLSLEQNPFGVLQSLLNVFSKERDSLYDQLKFAGSRDQGGAEGARFPFWLQLAAAALASPAAVLFSIAEAVARRGGTVEFIFEKTA